MGTVTLHTGTVGHVGPGTGLVVGTGPLWNDADDSSYIQSDDTEGAGQTWTAWAPLDVLTLPGDTDLGSVQVTVNLRASMSPPSDPSDTPANLGLGIYTGSEGSFPPVFADWVITVAAEPLTNSTGWSIDPAGSDPMNFTHTFNGDDAFGSGTSLPELTVRLQDGAKIYAYALSNGVSGQTVKIRVYELSVTVTYTELTVTGAPPVLYTPPATPAPPLRQWPRSDGLTSGARRGWPPPKSQQFSSRRGGGYL